MERTAPTLEQRSKQNKATSMDMSGISMGQYGFDVILPGDTDKKTNGDYGYCYLDINVNGTVFHGDTEIVEGPKGSDLVAAGTYDRGSAIVGLIKAVRITAGRVHAYKFPTKGQQ